MPQRKPKSIFDNASQLINSAVISPLSFLTGRSIAPPKPDEVFGGDFDLGEDEVLDEERGEEAEVDDSPEPGRVARVLGVIDKLNRDKFLTYQARNRRRWQIFGLKTVQLT